MNKPNKSFLTFQTSIIIIVFVTPIQYLLNNAADRFKLFDFWFLKIKSSANLLC